MSKEKYFFDLVGFSHNFLDRLPIEKTPQPLDYCLSTLAAAVKAHKDEALEQIRKIRFAKSEWARTGLASPGLNTVGLLVDRLTILIIKEWCLRNKYADVKKADDLHRTQTSEIIAALAESRKGYSSINSKITSIKTPLFIEGWDEAFFEMLCVNLLLWESQEVLYIRDIALLPPEELRAYIRWFAEGNMKRNVLIEMCERHYWERHNE